LLLAFALPLCCCEVPSYLGFLLGEGHAGCGPNVQVAAGTHAEHHAHDDALPVHTTAADGSHSTSNPAPAPCHDSDRCDCGHQLRSIPGSPQAIDFSAAPGIFVGVWAPSDTPAGPLCVRLNQSARSRASPATPLLRLHCALTI
jgi:hypothetical protein